VELNCHVATAPVGMQVMSPFAARLLLITIIGVPLVSVLAGASPPTSVAVAGGQDMADVRLYRRVIERLQTGEAYYDALGDELRNRGYATVPVFNWRTPMFLTSIAILTLPVARVLLSALGLLLVVTGALGYARRSTPKAAAAAPLLVGAVAPALLVGSDAVLFSENWAGVFIGLSLNAYLWKRRTLAAGLGVFAVFIRELAVPYALLCGVLALKARRAHESAVWILGGVAYAAYFALHASAVNAAIQPHDIAHVHSWIRWLGPSFAVMTLRAFSFFIALPPAALAVCATLGLAGAWAPSAWPHLTGSVLVYFILFCVVGQPFDFYWGFLSAPIWGHAFVHSMEGLHHLLRAAFRCRQC
jgi:hypothetical protein